MMFDVFCEVPIDEVSGRFPSLFISELYLELDFPSGRRATIVSKVWETIK